MTRPIIHGAYAHPRDLWATGARLCDFGINAVFIHSGEIDAATVARARDEGCLVFAEFAMLNGGCGDYVNLHPEARPIDDQGKPVAPATWFMGVCPTHRGFREARMDALRDLLAAHELDGVWMDYLHWHAQFEDPYPVFAKTCFSRSCLKAFEAWADVRVVGHTVADRARWVFANAARAWEDWRVSVVVDWAREFRLIVKEMQPEALVGAFHCAWRDEDLGGVQRRCLGLDIEALKPHVDVFSPMVYHGRSGKPVDYVREYVEYFSERHAPCTGPGEFPRLWPIVQAHDDPRIEPAEFGQALRHGLSGRSSGVMMFTIGSVAKDAAKTEAMRAVFRDG